MEEEDDDLYGNNGDVAPKREDDNMASDDGDDNQSEQMDEDAEDESDSVGASTARHLRLPVLTIK
ncbi:MAG: hypothetical protein INR71_01360 [Terriglobus roseus]|nr:hypothetical protein [Terriglobus roseus]